MQALIDQYTDTDEDQRLVRQYITRLEYDTTLHVLNELLEPASQIAEIGAATGRYSFTLAEEGHQVTAVELVPDQVNLLKEKSNDLNIPLAIFEGNATDLSFLADQSQDACLVLGPLYHLKTKAERTAALHEAKRVVKPGGFVAVAYISRFFVAGMFAQKFPELIHDGVLEQLNDTGCVTAERAPRFFKVGYFATPEEMESLLTEEGLSIMRHLATDGFGRYIASSVNEYSEETYERWKAYHLATCDAPSLLGSSNHGLVIGRVT